MNRSVELRRVTLQAGPARLGALSFEVEAHCYRDFAVHRCCDLPHLWQISLLPLGFCLAVDWCAFDDRDAAIAAMIEMAFLRNDWHVIRQCDLTMDLEVRLKAIAARHGAPERWEVGARGMADHNKFGRRISARPNGYGPALDG